MPTLPKPSPVESIQIQEAARLFRNGSTIFYITASGKVCVLQRHYQAFKERRTFTDKEVPKLVEHERKEFLHGFGYVEGGTPKPRFARWSAEQSITVAVAEGRNVMVASKLADVLNYYLK